MSRSGVISLMEVNWWLIFLVLAGQKLSVDMLAALDFCKLLILPRSTDSCWCLCSYPSIPSKIPPRGQCAAIVKTHSDSAAERSTSFSSWYFCWDFCAEPETCFHKQYWANNHQKHSVWKYQCLKSAGNWRYYNLLPNCSFSSMGIQWQIPHFMWIYESKFMYLTLWYSLCWNNEHLRIVINIILELLNKEVKPKDAICRSEYLSKHVAIIYND